MLQTTRCKTIIKTLWWSIAASVIGYIISFFLAPYVTDKMGVEAYGYVSLTKTIVEYGALITTAINSYAVRYIGIEYHNNKYDKANEYFNSVLFADIFLGICIVLASLFLIPAMEKVLKIQEELILDVQKLMILSVLNFAINTIMTAFSSAAYLKNKLDLNYFFRMIGYVAEIILLLLLFGEFEAKLFYIGISYVVDSFVILCSRIWMTRSLTPELKVDKTYFRILAIKELLMNGIWNSINSLGNILNTGLDMLITSMMLSAADLGMLGIVKTFPNMFVLLYQLVSQPFQPMLLKSYSLGDRKQLKKQLQSAMKLSGLVTIIGYTLFVSVGKSFYELWLPGQDAVVLYRLTIIALLPNAIEGVLYPCYYIYTLCVKNKIPCFVTIVGGIFNVAGMYFLIKYTSLGIYAVLFTTVVVMMVITLITNPIYMASCLNVKCAFFYQTIFKYLICGGIICVLMKFVASFFTIDSWIVLIGISAVVVILSVLIYFLVVFDRTERKMLIKSITGAVLHTEIFE